MVRLIGATVVAGAFVTHQLRILPPLSDLILAAMAMPAIILTGSILELVAPVRFKRVRSTLLGLASLMLSMCWTIYLADQRLSDTLDPVHENVVTRLNVRIKTMSQQKDLAQIFQAEVLDPVQQGIPKHIQVIWRAASENILPGQAWRAAMVLRRPHGSMNPSGFDYEGLMFQRNIRAIGQVRGHPKLISDDESMTFTMHVDRIRHHLRSLMQAALKDARYGPVLIALAIGDQDGVQQSDWDVFNRTGITHLVSISGSHVTMIGACGGVVALWLFKLLRFRSRYFCESLPAKPVAAAVAMLVAFLYCLLAGWGVPARRTFLMLAVTAFVVVARLPFSPSRVLSAAAALVVMMDPWSVLSTGFWLSFFAVGILFSIASMPASSYAQSHIRQWLRGLKDASRLQWLITLAMFPILAFLFQQITLSSIFANAIAIPVMTFVVTPLALLTALIAPLPGLHLLAQGCAWLGHEALLWMMIPVNWMATAKWAVLDINAFPVFALLVALAGMCWSMQVPGIASRWAGWFLMLPALAWQPQRPIQGGWTMRVFDVGQGAAVLISTARHHVLYDTGKKSGSSDSTMRVLLPAFRAMGVKNIDWLVVSHSDLDHAGGLNSLLMNFPIRNLVYSSGVEKHFPDHVHSILAGEIKKQLCDSRSSWTLDGVVFSILNGPAEDAASADSGEFTIKRNQTSNARSCILKLEGLHHRALLPGDIGIGQESKLMENADIAADVVLIPHHGSKTSSSDKFVALSGARHAIAQVGHLNRFRHPDPMVVQRWQRNGTQVWRTDHHGSVLIESTEAGLEARSLRYLNGRYWHHPIHLSQTLQ